MRGKASLALAIVSGVLRTATVTEAQVPLTSQIEASWDIVPPTLSLVPGVGFVLAMSPEAYASAGADLYAPQAGASARSVLGGALIGALGGGALGWILGPTLGLSSHSDGACVGGMFSRTCVSGQKSEEEKRRRDREVAAMAFGSAGLVVGFLVGKRIGGGDGSTRLVPTFLPSPTGSVRVGFAVFLTGF